MSETAKFVILISICISILICFFLFIKEVDKKDKKRKEFFTEYVYRIDHNNYSDYTNEIDESTPGVLKYTNQDGEEVRVYGNFSISKGEYKVFN